MSGRLHSQVFRAGRNYHSAVARYAAALRGRGDLERSAQEVMGTSLHYRVALDEMLAYNDSLDTRRRIECLRKLLACASRQYSLRRKLPKDPTVRGA